MPARSISLKVSVLLLYLCALLQLVGAVSQNISIDDQNGDVLTGIIPKYAPLSVWGNQACAGCAIKPDPNQLFEHTATGATFMPDKNVSSNTIDFDFNGTAIYIFFTLFYNEGNGITVNTECNFTLDNGPPVFFNHSGDPTVPAQTKRDYQALVFSKEGLEHKPHHMQIRMSDVPYHVFLSFDYALYTIDKAANISTNPTTDPSSPITQSSNSTTQSSNPATRPNNVPVSTSSPHPEGSSKPSSSSKTSEPAISLMILGGFVYQFVRVMYMG